MNSSAQSQASHVREWAVKQLGLPADATAEQARVAFLQRLDQSDFSRSDSSCRALAVLDHSIALSALEAAQFEKELGFERREECRSQIEDFAARFWKLAPADRRKEWERLQECSRGIAPLIARLDTFQAGLDVRIDLQEFEKKRASQPFLQLVEALMELFPLSPAIRAAERRAWLAGIDRDAIWNAAMSVRDEHPDIAALDPVLIKDLAINYKRLIEEEKKQQESKMNGDQDQSPFQGPRRSGSAGASETAESSDFFWGYGLYAIFGCIVFLSALFRGVYGDRTSNSNITPHAREPARISTPSLRNPDAFRPEVPAEFLTANGKLRVLSRDDPRIMRNPKGYKAWKSAGGEFLDEVTSP